MPELAEAQHARWESGAAVDNGWGAAAPGRSNDCGFAVMDQWRVDETLWIKLASLVELWIAPAGESLVDRD